MFGNRGQNKAQNRIDSLIGAGTQIDGNIRFAGGLRIDGEVRGNVESIDSAASAVLVLSEQARIEGGVNVPHLVVNGCVAGPVVARESLEMQSAARIIGDVEYAVIEMHQGAVIEGRLLHRGKEAELNPPPSN